MADPTHPLADSRVARWLVLAVCVVGLAQLWIYQSIPVRERHRAGVDLVACGLLLWAAVLVVVHCLGRAGGRAPASRWTEAVADAVRPVHAEAVGGPCDGLVWALHTGRVPERLWLPGCGLLACYDRRPPTRSAHPGCGCVLFSYTYMPSVSYDS